MKQCFLHCAVFPKDSNIVVEKLIKMWMALGYLSSTRSTSNLELRGVEYFNYFENAFFLSGLRGIWDRKTRKLRDLPNNCTRILHLPQGFQQLTGLRALRLFHAGGEWSILGCLRNLEKLSGSLELKIMVHDREDVDEAQNAELRNKIHVRKLTIFFINAMVKTEAMNFVRNEAMEALQPPPKLHCLNICLYKGTNFPGWISSSLNHLRVLRIDKCNYILALPCLGKLPELEELSVWRMGKLKFVGREFLGINDSMAVETRFPKLKNLSFWNCPRWKEWKDITTKEEGSATAVLTMP
ncbi:putative disease resistance protein RGA4 [Sesamum alatum]|uniref:Disease resistance protein RGA4 n=1 Tax=Sesamum alatum TaxID=300844 RepID=A0AAE1YBQ1_9LAMI|nr:putative disease resistance protein RGA4 [Sesamum alatum]